MCQLKMSSGIVLKIPFPVKSVMIVDERILYFAISVLKALLSWKLAAYTKLSEREMCCGWGGDVWILQNEKKD